MQDVLQDVSQTRDLVRCDGWRCRRQTAPIACAAEKESVADRQQDPGQVEKQHDQDAMIGEKGTGEQDVNRQFGTAGEKRDHSDGEVPVAMGRKSSGRQNRRNTAAETGDKRQDGFARKADPVHRMVQDPGDVIHVPAVFQQGKKEKQRGDRRKKGKDAADTGADAVNDQLMNPERDIAVCQILTQQSGQIAEQMSQRPGKPDLRDLKSSVKNPCQDQQKYGNRQITIHKDPVRQYGFRFHSIVLPVILCRVAGRYDRNPHTLCVQPGTHSKLSGLPFLCRTV